MTYCFASAILHDAELGLPVAAFLDNYADLFSFVTTISFFEDVNWHVLLQYFVIVLKHQRCQLLYHRFRIYLRSTLSVLVLELSYLLHVSTLLGIAILAMWWRLPHPPPTHHTSGTVTQHNKCKLISVVTMGGHTSKQMTSNAFSCLLVHIKSMKGTGWTILQQIVTKHWATRTYRILNVFKSTYTKVFLNIQQDSSDLLRGDISCSTSYNICG